MPETEQNEINIKLFLFELFGFNVFLSYIGGLPLLRRLTDSYSNHLSSLLKLWEFFIFTASLNGIFGGYMINGSRKFLKQSIEATLFRGIEDYYIDPQWRLIWDGFQYNEQCCGVANFKDWQSLSWRTNLDENRSNESDENQLSVTPYSCCKKQSVCYGNTFREKASPIWIEIPPSINMTLINEEGCFQIFSQRLDETCAIILIVVGIVFILQIFIMICMTILMNNKTMTTKRTSNQQSQTDLPKGTPLLLSGSDSFEIVDECEQSDDDGRTVHKKTSKVYILKSHNRKNRVAFADFFGDDECDTHELLTRSTE
ncbi:hypothetical protein Bhyg_02155, partial [Pseudolycoriella hygida]